MTAAEASGEAESHRLLKCLGFILYVSQSHVDFLPKCIMIGLESWNKDICYSVDNRSKGNGQWIWYVANPIFQEESSLGFLGQLGRLAHFRVMRVHR